MEIGSQIMALGILGCDPTLFQHVVTVPDDLYKVSHVVSHTIKSPTISAVGQESGVVIIEAIATQKIFYF